MTPETKTVSIVSSDTVSRTIQLEITADVKPKPDTLLDLKYTPYSLEFKQEGKGKFQELKVGFTNKGPKEYKLRVIDYPRGLFQAKLNEETLMPGKMIELRVKPEKTLPAGALKKSISIKVTGEKEFRITIPVKTEGS